MGKSPLVIPVEAAADYRIFPYTLPTEVLVLQAKIEFEDDPGASREDELVATVTRAELGPKGQPIISARVDSPSDVAGQSITFTSSSIIRFIKRLSEEELMEMCQTPRKPPDSMAFISRHQKEGPWIEIKKAGATEPLLLCRDSKLAEALVTFLSAASSAW